MMRSVIACGLRSSSVEFLSRKPSIDSAKHEKQDFAELLCALHRSSKENVQLAHGCNFPRIVVLRFLLRAVDKRKRCLVCSV